MAMPGSVKWARMQLGAAWSAVRQSVEIETRSRTSAGGERYRLLQPGSDVGDLALGRRARRGDAWRLGGLAAKLEKELQWQKKVEQHWLKEIGDAAGNLPAQLLFLKLWEKSVDRQNEIRALLAWLLQYWESVMAQNYNWVMRDPRRTLPMP